MSRSALVPSSVLNLRYFEFNGYHHSLSTFTAGRSLGILLSLIATSETGTPEERPFSREVLQQEIGIQTTLEEEPLYGRRGGYCSQRILPSDRSSISWFPAEGLEVIVSARPWLVDVKVHR